MELTEKLQNLENNVTVLRDIQKNITLDEMRRNKRYEWEIRYGLFESIQIVIDVACKISSYYNLGNPKNYKECVELLKKHNYLTDALAQRIVSMVGLRNLLVHEYAEIDDAKLYNFLNYIDDFILFAEEMQENL